MYAPIYKHLRSRWIPENAIDPEVTAELLQQAAVAGVVEIERREENKLWARIAPHHAAKTTIGTWVTPTEAAKVRAHAHAAGLSVSQAIRVALEAAGLL